MLGTAGLLFAGLPVHAASVLSAEKAHQLAMAGKLLLIDIRTPEEWAETGSGQGARRLDMRRKDFASALDSMLKGDRGMPVALICARGARSSRLSRVLREAGYKDIIDVPEGMLGSYAGPGWIARNLPLLR
ncbi:rhodanese-like domain-containing protein [Aestuariivirga sp.]|uniref:rhodanese-like domain-containing protein n=1 Tax=Aestuariivirga sp. TaxID=2650926 RepID=UPI003593C15E